jgi:cytochrome c-type biogenesis protein CcmE
MSPTQRRRLLLVLLVLAAAGIALVLVTIALQRNVAYLYTPAEVVAGKVAPDARFRLGGMVSQGSFKREAGALQVRFEVTDGDAQLPVTYDRILPDLFREGQAVVATGRMVNGVFVAEDVLAKHDETYMPKELADKMGVAHTKHQVPADAPATTETP